MKYTFILHFLHSLTYRHLLLAILLLLVYLTQHIPAWGAFYAKTFYPMLASPLSRFSSLFPFSIGDLWVFCAIGFVLFYPFVGRIHFHQSAASLIGKEVEFLLWIYVWFYIAWGLNYAQPSFYVRMQISPAAYNEEVFMDFTHRYIKVLNDSYIDTPVTDKSLITKEVLKGYQQHAQELRIHAPYHTHLRPKTMLYSCLASKVGVTGSMAPFFCEYTINKDVRPNRYPSNNAHELSHLLGITNEAEANFYAYQICTQSENPFIRYSGYYSILTYVLSYARRLTNESVYRDLFLSIRPEIIQQLRDDQTFWQQKYSPLIGDIQNMLYDSYLKHHQISSGVKNYSEVIRLILSYEQAYPRTQCSKKEE